MTLSSVAIASKWDEPEKIKIFIVSIVRRKVLWSREGERHNCTKSKKCGAARAGEPLQKSRRQYNISARCTKVDTRFVFCLEMICTKSKLNEEIKHIKNILLDNGYPESIIDSNISNKIAQFSMPKRFGPEKCPVYLRVLWIGKASIDLDKNVKRGC